MLYHIFLFFFFQPTPFVSQPAKDPQIDLFGDLGAGSGQGWGSATSMPRNISTPNLNADPFADLTNLGTKLGASPGNSPSHRPSSWNTQHIPTATPKLSPMSKYSLNQGFYRSRKS